MIEYIDPDDEDNYKDADSEAYCFYDEPNDEPIWEPNESYTAPIYGSDTY